jgi:anti-anti-sigma regulatory factor
MPHEEGWRAIGPQAGYVLERGRTTDSQGVTVLRTSTTPAPDIGGLIVHLSGTAGMAEADQLQMLLNNIVSGRPRRVIFDFTGLELLTSICIGEMITFRKSLLAEVAAETGEKGRVVIASAAKGINQSLRFTRLDELFELFPDVGAARAALKV